MGKPATTYWCENGHLLEDNGKHVFGEYDRMSEEDYPKCPFCKSTKVLMEIEWGYPDQKSLVSHEPIFQDEIERQDHKGNEYFILVDAYDVSKLATVKHDK